MKPRFVFLPLALLLLGSPAAQAQQGHDRHHHHAAHSQAEAAVDTPATRGYKQAMATMHRDMKHGMSGNADVDFVRQMIPHHQAAVDMARIQLAYGRDAHLKQFSRWIIFAQDIEIRFMKQWLRGRDRGVARQGAEDYYGAAMQQMHRAMAISYTGDADRDFVLAMIPHHQGAIDMAAMLIARGVNPEIRALANDIYRAQASEIAWQHAWLAQYPDTPSFPTLLF